LSRRKPRTALSIPAAHQRLTIQATCQQWRSRGAEFLTPPKVHSREIRCYLRDPDGHLIEVGQTTGVPT
jgi:catechol 2,3-dioxygenase-like lactoylglutathione lyase family enzyme